MITMLQESITTIVMVQKKRIQISIMTFLQLIFRMMLLMTQNFMKGTETGNTKCSETIHQQTINREPILVRVSKE